MHTIFSQLFQTQNNAEIIKQKIIGNEELHRKSGFKIVVIYEKSKEIPQNSLRLLKILET